MKKILSYSQFFKFPCLVFISMIILGGISHGQQTPINPLDEKITTSDKFFTDGKYENAIAGYREIIQSPILPQEFKSLFLLRIAYAQKAKGETAECKKTLKELKSMDNVPKYRLLEIAGIEAELTGSTDPTLTRTPHPVYKKIAARIFVSSSASKENAHGTLKAPYPKLRKAFEKARELRKQPGLAEGAIEIAILDSVYKMDEPVVLDEQDTGTKRNPLIIRPANLKMRTLISGGCAITKWKTEDNPEILKHFDESVRGKVLVASLSENGVPPITDLVFGGFSSARSVGGNARFKTMPVPELFYKGVAQTFARWPNDSDTGLPLDGFTDERPLRWQNESDLWLHGYWYWKWADAYEKVERISPDEKKIYLAPPVNKYGFKESQWHAVNALSEIDVPGEWHLDTKKNIIHYLPHDNFDPSQCILSVYGPLIQGSDCNFVGFERIDATFFRGDCMVFKNCSDLKITDCSIYAGSGTGIIINGGLRHLIHTVSIEHMGRGGIDITAGDWRKLIPSEDIIENCRISDLSRIDRTYTPALLLDGMGFKLRYCYFKNIPSSAIRMESSESLIELNEFTNCVSESDDQGAIDVWGNPLYRGNIIRWNYFHDIKGRHGMVAGVRLDDAISGFMIYENIFLRSSGGFFGGVQIHGGKDSYVEGNIFIDCNTMISNSPWGDERWKKDLTTKVEITSYFDKTPWQSPEWLKRYPDLKHLMTGPADRNYLADNLGVNVKKMHNSFSPNMLFLNHWQVEIKPGPEFKDIEKLIVPWHPIPFNKIGVY